MLGRHLPLGYTTTFMFLKPSFGYRNGKQARAGEPETRAGRELINFFKISYLSVGVCHTCASVCKGRALSPLELELQTASHLMWVMECELRSLQPWQ